VPCFLSFTSSSQCACRRIGDGSDQQADTHATSAYVNTTPQCIWYEARQHFRQEIITGLKEWSEQTDNTLEAAAAEDADEVAIRMVTDEDGPDDSDNDSDYNSVDAERDDAQEDDDDEEKPKPKPKVPLLRVVSLFSRL
jgi:hypothetical protein